MVCDCADKDPDYVTEQGLKYSAAIEELVKSGRYDTRDDFTVVWQPFMRDSDIPRDVSKIVH